MASSSSASTRGQAARAHPAAAAHLLHAGWRSLYVASTVTVPLGPLTRIVGVPWKPSFVASWLT